MADRTEIVRAHERLVIAKTFIELVGEIRSVVLPDGSNDVGTLLVAAAVLVGHIEGRAMSASKIAHYVALPRTTVIRRLDELVRRGVIERRGRVYCLLPARNREVLAAMVRRAMRTIKGAADALSRV